MLLGNGPGIPLTFLIVTGVLLMFSVGYVAMARHIRNAGAFYAFTAQGLGGLMGGAAALLAILAYNAMQIGVFGLFGAATSGFMASLGLDLPWWAWTYIGIAAVAVLGYRRVDLSARVLTVLVVLEYLVVLVIDAAILFSGGDSGLTMEPFTPSAFLSGTPAIGILFCFAAFIGFEATTIYSEEARDPGRTVPRATYISVLIIGIFYMLTAWLMVNGAGAGKLVGELQALQDPTTFLFGLAERYVGHWIIPVMNLLFVTSLFAGVVAFHNGVARYMYVAGREGLLPRGLGVTHPQYQSPHVGSIVQTAIAITVVGIFAVTGQDPVLALFSWATNVGTLAIMLLMTFTAFAIIAFCAPSGAGKQPLHHARPASGDGHHPWPSGDLYCRQFRQPCRCKRLHGRVPAGPCAGGGDCGPAACIAAQGHQCRGLRPAGRRTGRLTAEIPALSHKEGALSAFAI